MISCGFTAQWQREGHGGVGVEVGGMPCHLLYCFNQALLGGICEIMRMKVSQRWRGSRQSLDRHCANFPMHLLGLIYQEMNGVPKPPH